MGSTVSTINTKIPIPRYSGFKQKLILQVPADGALFSLDIDVEFEQGVLEVHMQGPMRTIYVRSYHAAILQDRIFFSNMSLEHGEYHVFINDAFSTFSNNNTKDLNDVNNPFRQRSESGQLLCQNIWIEATLRPRPITNYTVQLFHELIDRPE